MGFLGRRFAAAPKTRSSPLSPRLSGQGGEGERGVRGRKGIPSLYFAGAPLPRNDLLHKPKEHAHWTKLTNCGRISCAFEILEGSIGEHEVCDQEYSQE